MKPAAALLIDELRERGVRVRVDAGKLKLAPRDRVTPELVERIRANKDEIKVILAPITSPDSDEAYASLLKTLAFIEDLHNRAPMTVRPRIRHILAEHTSVIEWLFERRDFSSLRFALIDLERNVSDAIRRRGYDN